MATVGKAGAAGAPEAATPSGPVDLTGLIDKKSIVCLNQSSANPIGNALSDRPDSFVESDCDDQLLVTLPFNSSVKIMSITIRSPDVEHAPSKVRLFANRLNLDFDSAVSVPAEQEFDLDAGVAQGSGVNLKLYFVKFQNVNSLTLFFPGPTHGGEETTRISRIQVTGITSQAQNFAVLKEKSG
jgi:hypothetical protein